MKTIGQDMLDFPAHAPVMVLPGATLFPDTLLPLRIFEPRYRKMLLWSLERHRMFCVALMKPGIIEARSVDDFHHVAGLGVVRACVQRADGTSDLVLQGVARVELTGFIEGTPFRLAEMQERRTLVALPSETALLTAELLALCAAFHATGAALPEKLAEQLSAIPDAGWLADVVAHTLLGDPSRRQQILEEASVADRLRAVIRCLGEETA